MIFHQTCKKIADLVDLEWFLHRREEDPTKALEKPVSLPDGRLLSDFSDRKCLEIWLKTQREACTEKGFALPGRKVVFSLNILFFLTVLLAFGLGGTISFGILHYDGHLPINLLYALGVLVFLPFATVVATLLAMIFYRKRSPLSHTLVLHGFRKLLFFMLSGVDFAFSGRKRDQVLSLKRRMENFSRKYAAILRSLLFFVFQLGGFFLVVGMLCAFLVKVAGSDLAFAWQSTLNLQPEEFARFLEILGSPWKPFFPEAIPDLGQIEGSRVFLKEGIAGLSGENLAVWWRFITMALLVYGIFPRFLFLIFSFFMFRKRVFTSFPDDSRTKALCFFLRSSAVRFRETEDSFWEREIAPDQRGVFRAKEAVKFSHLWELWINEEIPEGAKEYFLPEIRKLMGSEPARIHSVDMGNLPAFSEAIPLVFAFEVFMPPVLEDLRILQEISEKKRSPLWIWPVGRSDTPSPYVPRSDDLVIWKKKLETLPEPRPVLLRRADHGT